MSDALEMTTAKRRSPLRVLSRLLIPALMFQAVAHGGAYATGREVIEFGAVYGGLGWTAGVAMAATGTLLAYLVYETARRWRLFDYRAMTQHLIGRWYWLFDLIYIPFAIAIIAVLSSAAGNMLLDTLSLPYWGGVSVIIVVTAVVVFAGAGFVERFNSVGTVALMCAYAAFSILVITTHVEQIDSVLAGNDHSLKPHGTLLDAALLGAVYVGLGFVVYPSTLMTVRHLHTRRDSAVSAIFTGALYVVPWFLAYFALMGFYPAGSVFDAPVPWLEMLRDQPRWVTVVYGVVVGWTLVAASVGLVQSIVQRVDSNLADLGRSTMKPSMRVGITAAALLFGALLSAIGIVDLIAVGYMIGAIALIVVFGIPLFIKGARYLMPGGPDRVTVGEELS
ncbi:hypothetical protein [Nocardia africana]|uniref:Uncharacterized membrane protein n=1 Tax=Nocardia africana TaxID=134964 RepID=A0A378WUS0_9NOCA|nr:hypothetical protein [Nocardia africana]MCC3313718.1 hypothetical protein [Nocardia africana]SUA44899.1 Uncharacterized membrane protein [Nocardia africana]